MINNNEINEYIKDKKKLKKLKKLRILISISLISILGLTLFSSKILNMKVTTNNITDINNSPASIPSSATPLADDGVFTICLDAGHGDWDFGAVGLNNSAEKDVVLSVTLKLGELLESEGIKVVYTRTSDTLSWSDDSTENLYDRVNISKNNNSDLFLSLHCNSSDESPTYNGIETWYNSDDNESILFATYIQDELGALEYSSDRGTKYYSSESPLAVLDHNNVPSALIELGFLSNWSDESFLTSENGQNLSAEAIFNGILSYVDTLNKNTHYPIKG